MWWGLERMGILVPDMLDIIEYWQYRQRVGVTARFSNSPSNIPDFNCEEVYGLSFTILPT